MSKILITGTSGFIGSALAQSMAQNHDVVCLSRGETEVDGVTAIQGDFTSPADLRKLEPHTIDAVIHLAAVTGGGDEAELLRANVLGTYHLLRYFIDLGCKKFVLASSIAAVGFQSTRFRPLQLPMPDEHPCLDRIGYGLSKYMMEEVTRYLSRQNEDLDFINIRLASIVPEDRVLTPRKAGPVMEWAMGSLSIMYLSDTVRCLTMAAESLHKPGVRILNAVGTQACAEDTVPEIIRAWYGADADKIDLSHYERPGHERDPVFDITRIQTELGFVPERSVRPE
ncbi:MAG: NAD(P)-dependent oxidoreductase [Candidatus Poribacteria bacterium]|nr:NAD(P)-dependent oxidoreductase [Candidatus Poribacteria bacterium]